MSRNLYGQKTDVSVLRDTQRGVIGRFEIVTSASVSRTELLDND